MSAQQTGTWDDDDDDDVVEEVQQQDSSAMRALRKADRAKAKRISELEERLASFETAARVRSVESVLQARNLSPKIAGLIPGDVEPTEAAIGTWLDSFSEIFGATQQTPVPDEEEQQQIAQMRQMDALSEMLQPPQALADLGAKINQAQTREELDALIFGGGAGR